MPLQRCAPGCCCGRVRFGAWVPLKNVVAKFTPCALWISCWFWSLLLKGFRARFRCPWQCACGLQCLRQHAGQHLRCALWCLGGCRCGVPPQCVACQCAYLGWSLGVRTLQAARWCCCKVPATWQGAAAGLELWSLRVGVASGRCRPPLPLPDVYDNASATLPTEHLLLSKVYAGVFFVNKPVSCRQPGTSAQTSQYIGERHAAMFCWQRAREAESARRTA